MINPDFSIIIPSYNGGVLIEKSINSILNQNFAAKEIIVIDGDSTDNTLSIIEKFRIAHSPCFKYFSEKDNGIYDAMNKGIKIAKGEWIFFMGTDDSLYDVNVLTTVRTAINLNTKAKIFYGNVHTSGNYVQKYSQHTFRKLVYLNICHQAIFYHRSLFEKYQYDLNYPICADWDFNLKVFNRRNSPKYLNQIVSNYNLNGASKNWQTHPDFLINFSNKKQVILRYRSIFYLIYTYIITRPVGIQRKLRQIYRWTFQ